MTPRTIFLARLKRGKTPRPAVGSATSIVTTDLMEKVGVFFPDAHRDAEPMARLAAAGHTELGFDNIMPLFSVWHESAALGCNVNWGDRAHMPDCPQPLYANLQQAIRIPRDLLKQPGCAVPLRALRLLQRRYGHNAAIVGKVFGPWTLGYHVFGVQEFLMATLLQPDAVRRVLRRLIEVTVRFANAQVEAGADAITVGDHCTRDLCAPAAYRDFLLEIHQELHARIHCPLILHICGDTSDRLPWIAQTGIECLHFDSKVPVHIARKLAGTTMALMGGTSNYQVIRLGSPATIARDIQAKRSAGIDILGPECAVPLDAPCRNLKLLAAEAKR